MSVIRAEEPDYFTPALPPPHELLDSVRALWREDSLGVKWALAQLTADLEWFGEMRAGMYGRYYEELSGEAGPLLYYIGHTPYPDWRDAIYRITKPLTSTEEAFVFWQACMALWPIVQIERDSTWRSIIEGPYPIWLRVSATMLASTFRYVTPRHQDILAGAVREDTWGELGIPPPGAR